ncbi:hypothetical protein Mgra_00000299 [Meloidogyne graminicola]|uniref:Uncharacterized protein n=1 Tax=Meloidogyne graminicola TaxID=189291 RepID=A0A8T0A506_9BILA|nr:hypothetical protein Mgra_00000299 [Meloidogyne graminicola]
MKNRFFKKSSSNSKNEYFPQNSLINTNNTTLENNLQKKSPSFNQKLFNSFNPSSSSLSSTQGIIGCCSSSNGLFECCSNNNVSNHLFPTEMQLIAEGKRAYFGRIKKQSEVAIWCRQSIINYSPLLPHKQQLIEHQRLLQHQGRILINEENKNNNQIAQLVFTLVQQLNLKDFEIIKIKNKLKRKENKEEKNFEKLNEELKIKEEEIMENKEEIKRLKRKLKNKEIELNKVLNNKIINMEEMKESDKEKLIIEISELQNKLKLEQKCRQNKQIEWEEEKQKFNKKIKISEENCKQLEMQLELIKIENNCLNPTFVGKEREEQADSSSGISSSLKGINRDKYLNNKLIKANGNLIDVREKIKQLIQTTEKLEKGERLKGEDLFVITEKSNNLASYKYFIF